jgi:hypothetical protein
MSADGKSIKNSKHLLLYMVTFQGPYISLEELHDQIPKRWPGWEAKVSGLGRRFLDGLFDLTRGDLTRGKYPNTNFEMDHLIASN